MTEPRDRTPDEILAFDYKQFYATLLAERKAEAWQREVQFRLKAALWIVGGCLLAVVSAWMGIRGIG